MTKSKMANRYSPEVRARAVRMVFEQFEGSAHGALAQDGEPDYQNPTRRLW